MKKLKIIFLLLAVISSVFTTKNNKVFSTGCINSYDYFSSEFLLVEDYELSYPNIYPDWQIETEIESSNSTVSYDIELVFERNNRIEIWILETNFITKESKIIIYYPDSGEKEFISGKIETSEVYVSKLFYFEDIDKIIGVNSWNNSRFDINQEIYILSEYNPINHEFNYIEQSTKIDQNSSDSGRWHYFFQDNIDSNFIWYVIPNSEAFQNNFQEEDNQTLYGTIVMFDLVSKEEIKFIDLIDIYYTNILLSKNNDFYITENINKMSIGGKQDLLNISTRTGEISKIIEMPEDWFVIKSMLEDNQGNIWFDNFGYFNIAKNDLTYFYPRAKELRLEFFNKGFSSINSEIISYISSDGTLWFSHYTFDSLGVGMAWYNPISEIGCWFTNISEKKILEGPNNTIYIFLDNKLFKFEL